MFLFLLLSLLFLFIYVFGFRNMQYWRRRNVVQDDPVPFLGSNVNFLLGKMSYPDLVMLQYWRYPNLRYYGTYHVSKPTVIIRDVELSKKITTTDFEYFMNHQEFSGSKDLLWSRNVFALKGSQWREMRRIMTPNFTGAKMKMMFGLMSKCAEQYSKNIVNDKNARIEVNVCDVVKRFANDVIASLAFGIELDSYTDKTNEFYNMGQIMIDLTNPWNQMKVILAMFSSNISDIFNIKLFDRVPSKFFTNMIRETIKMREETGLVRLDMIHLLMEVKKQHELDKSSFQLSEIDIFAQLVLFFFAGFDTVATTIAFACYEISKDDQVQQRLRQEILETMEETNGNVTYDAINKMKYMDAVVVEVARLWPNVVNIDRRCTKDYVIEPEQPHEKTVTIEKGTLLSIPIYGIQRDSKYYDNPNEFIPDRFYGDSCKSNMAAFMTFGIGPRACLGSRFSYMEIKIFLFYLLSKMDIKPSKITPIPMKLQNQFKYCADPGIFVDLTDLNTNK